MRSADMTASVVPTRNAANACIDRLPGTRTGVRPDSDDTISTATQTLIHNQADQASTKAASTIQVSATDLSNSWRSDMSTRTAWIKPCGTGEPPTSTSATGTPTATSTSIDPESTPWEIR
jgi:predicted P-loop ATPase